MENKNHSKKKQEKKIPKQKNNKQFEEEKEVISQQEIVQPKIFTLSKKTSRYLGTTRLKIHSYTNAQYNSTKIRYSRQSTV